MTLLLPGGRAGRGRADSSPCLAGLLEARPSFAGCEERDGPSPGLRLSAAITALETLVVGFKCLH